MHEQPQQGQPQQPARQLQQQRQVQLAGLPEPGALMAPGLPRAAADAEAVLAGAVGGPVQVAGNPAAAARASRWRQGRLPELPVPSAGGS